MSDAAAPGAFDGLSKDVTADGVFRVVLEGYDAVYDALPSGQTFSRLWRMNAYGGDFPEQFAHIGFLTVPKRNGCGSCCISGRARRWPTWPAAPGGRVCGWLGSRRLR